jgi:hypothetical protein
MGGEHDGGAVLRADEDPLERRAFDRRDVKRTTLVFFEPSDRSVACTIRNISRGGARIVLGEAMVLPERVTLLVGVGDYRRALVRWRIGLEAGLEFVG